MAEYYKDPAISPDCEKETRPGEEKRYDDSGDGLRIQRSVNSTGRDIDLYHMHTTYEVHVAVTGSTTLECGTLQAHLQGPYVAIHRPYMPHRAFFKYEGVPYFRFILNFSEEFLRHASYWTEGLEELCSQAFFAFELSAEQMERIQPHLETAYRMFRQKRDGQCQLAVAMGLDEIVSMQPEVRVIASSGGMQYLDEVIHYMVTHISEKLSCAEVAAQFYISESKLSQDFKKSFGLPFNQYVTQLRVKMAKDMLSRGESGTKTARSCGFCSSSYFISIFKKFTGMTPGEYIDCLQRERKL